MNVGDLNGNVNEGFSKDEDSSFEDAPEEYDGECLVNTNRIFTTVSSGEAFYSSSNAASPTVAAHVDFFEACAESLDMDTNYTTSGQHKETFNFNSTMVMKVIY